MYYVGIDVGKNNHVASMMDASRKAVFKAFAFPNTREGGQSLLEKIRSHAADQAQVEIGMEATGHYWLALYSFLFDAGYTLHVINPIQTDGWRKGVEIRKRKTDDIDRRSPPPTRWSRPIPSAWASSAASATSRTAR